MASTINAITTGAGGIVTTGDSSGQIALQSNGTTIATFTTSGVSGLANQIAWNTTIQTTGFTATSGSGYYIDTTSAAFTVTLPASPNTGDVISLVDVTGKFATNNLTINPNSLKINGTTSSATLSTNREGVTLTYTGSTNGWVAASSTVVSGASLPQTYTVSYLLVAGGGGGSGNGGAGGGAGGLLSGTTTLTSGTAYTAVVGGGGSAGPAPSPYQGGTGSNSTFPGVTNAVGGGYGGAAPFAGGSGGSGGGGGQNSTAAGSGTPGQGNNGGSSTPTAAAGGGGSGSVGSTGSAPAGGAGGSGSANSITGTPANYAGGGGGSGPSSGGSATSGGGAGGGGSSSGTAGTANTGAGGGGGWNTGGAAGGAGGSGVVIISVPTSSYSGTTTGSPTITTSGSNTIIKWTSGSGTYTA